MIKRLMVVIGALILGLSLAAVGCAAPGEVEPADFYKGKTIDFTNCTPPGGATDLIARLEAIYLTKYTGAATVVTIRKEAGGSEGPSWVYRAKPDGLSMGSWIYNAMLLNELNEAPGADYKLDKFTYLLSVMNDPSFFWVAPKGPYQSVTDLKAGKGLKIAATSLRGWYTTAAVSICSLLDLDAKVITGYMGTAQTVLSIEQGETAGQVIPIGTAMQYVQAGRIKPLFVLSTERYSLYPDLPCAAELVPATGEKREMVEMLQAFSETYPLFLTPGVPDDRVKFLQEVGKKIISDPEFRSEMDKIIGYKVGSYRTGEEFTKFAQDLGTKVGSYKSLIDTLIKQYSLTK